MTDRSFITQGTVSNVGVVNATPMNDAAFWDFVPNHPSLYTSNDNTATSIMVWQAPTGVGNNQQAAQLTFGATACHGAAGLDYGLSTTAAARNTQTIQDQLACLNNAGLWYSSGIYSFPPIGVPGLRTLEALGDTGSALGLSLNNAANASVITGNWNGFLTAGNMSLVGQAAGVVLTSSLGSGGSGYVLGDTFTVNGTCNAGTATGLVTSITGGTVVTYTLSPAGIGCSDASGVSTTALTGVGSGLTINILSVSPTRTAGCLQVLDNGIVQDGGTGPCGSSTGSTSSFNALTAASLHSTGNTTVDLVLAVTGASNIHALSATTIAGTTVTGTGIVQGAGFTATAAAPTVAAAQVGFGSTTAAASNCNSVTLSGGITGTTNAAGCLVINVAGTTHYVPYY
jgi:hypothetical protein